MKKMLLAATAAAVVGGVAFAGTPAQAQEAEGFSLRIGGFYNALMIVRNQDDNALGQKIRSYDFNQRGRYRIQGSQTLDSGLMVGFDTQYEMQAGMNNNRSYVYARGGFGNVQFGTMYSAPYLMHVSPPTAGWGIDDTGHSQGFSTINGLGFPATPTYYINRSMNLTYMTPRFGGFQAGLTFAPDQRNVQNMNNRRATNLSAQNATAVGSRFADLQNIVGMSANFQQSFDAFSLGLSLGAETGTYNQGAKNILAGVHRRAWTVGTGLNVGFGDFNLGVAYNWDNAGIDNVRIHNLTAGATYSVEGFTFGPSFGMVRERGSNSPRRQLYVYEFGARYAFAPGVNLVGSVEHARYYGGVLGNAGKGNGTAGLLGVQFSF